MNDVMQLASRDRRFILVVWLCMVIGPFAQAFDLVWLPPSSVAGWLGQQEIVQAYETLWQSVHHVIGLAGDQGLMPLGYSDWALEGIPVLFVFACVAALALFFGLITMTALAMDLRGLQADLLPSDGNSDEASGARDSFSSGQPYRPVTKAIIESIESNLQACEAGLIDAQDRLAQSRQTVINLSLDPAGPRSSHDLALLREQLDQVRRSMDRQRGPQHAMMANLSKL